MLAPKINDDYDLIINHKNNISMVDSLDEIAQSIRIRLGVNKGEWVFNTQFGLDYNSLIDSGFNENLVKAKVLEALREENRIIDIQEINLNYDSLVRKIYIDLKLKVEDTSTESGDNILELSTILG